MAQQQAQSDLEAEMDRLQRSIEMLGRSNKELKDAMQHEPDPEYKQAIDENVVIIAKYRARVYALQEELRRLRGMHGAGVHEAIDTIRQQQEPPVAPPAARGADSGGDDTRMRDAPAPAAPEGAAAEEVASAAALAGASGAGGGGAELGAGGQQRRGGRAGAPGDQEGVWL